MIIEADEYKKAVNQEYNMTWDINLTLLELHEIIFNLLKPEGFSIKFEDFWIKNEKSKNTYPSVHWGPISNKKWESNFEKLGFKSSNTKVSIEQSVDFFRKIVSFEDYKDNRIKAHCPYEDEFGKRLNF